MLQLPQRKALTLAQVPLLARRAKSLMPLQEVMKAYPSLTDEQKSAATEWIAVAADATVGGQNGTAAALNDVNHTALKACEALADAATCKADVSQRYSGLDFEQERQTLAARESE